MEVPNQLGDSSGSMSPTASIRTFSIHDAAETFKPPLQLEQRGQECGNRPQGGPTPRNDATAPQNCSLLTPKAPGSQQRGRDASKRGGATKAPCEARRRLLAAQASDD